MSSQAQKQIAELDQELDSCFASAREKALKSNPVHDANWNAFLISLDIEPVGEDLRAQILQSGMPELKGALPRELRKVLVVYRDDIAKRLADIKLTVSDDETLAIIRDLELKLRYQIDTDMKEYLTQARKTVTMNSIFANALKTSSGPFIKEDDVDTLACSCCGAARSLTTDSQYCQYCGNHLFDKESNRG